MEFFNSYEFSIGLKTFLICLFLVLIFFEAKKLRRKYSLKRAKLDETLSSNRKHEKGNIQ